MAVGVTKNEMLLWHQQYLACCAELNQWDTVVEYAKVTDNCLLQIDAMVQLHDWQNLKAVSYPRAVLCVHVPRDPCLKVLRHCQ